MVVRLGWSRSTSCGILMPGNPPYYSQVPEASSLAIEYFGYGLLAVVVGILGFQGFILWMRRFPSSSRGPLIHLLWGDYVVGMLAMLPAFQVVVFTTCTGRSVPLRQ